MTTLEAVFVTLAGTATAIELLPSVTVDVPPELTVTSSDCTTLGAAEQPLVVNETSEDVDELANESFDTTV